MEGQALTTEEDYNNITTEEGTMMEGWFNRGR